jgi:hypothetical protein
MLRSRSRAVRMAGLCVALLPVALASCSSHGAPGDRTTPQSSTASRSSPPSPASLPPDWGATEFATLERPKDRHHATGIALGDPAPMTNIATADLIYRLSPRDGVPELTWNPHDSVSWDITSNATIVDCRQALARAPLTQPIRQLRLGLDMCVRVAQPAGLALVAIVNTPDETGELRLVYSFHAL